MTPKNTLWALLALMFACGLADAQYAASHMRMPAWWALLSALLLNFLPYYWYRLDSIKRRCTPPYWMTSAVVALAPLGIPAYLAYSRPRGARLRAMVRMCSFLVQMLAAGMAGVLAFFLMPG